MKRWIVNGLVSAVVTGSLVLSSATAPLRAADLGGELSYKDAPPEYRPRSVWEGLYYGVSAGYGWGESEHYYDLDDHGSAIQDLEGALASVTFGYNYQVSPMLLVGIEADAGVMDLEADDDIVFDGHLWKSQFGPFWGTLRGRAGLILNGVLLYGTGGLAFMSIDETGYGDTDGQNADNRDFRTGWTVGGGIEFALGHGVTSKIEYLHMDFDSYDGITANGEDYQFDSNVDVVRAGLSFRF